MLRHLATVLPGTLLWLACAATTSDAQSTARPVSTNVRSANSRLAGALVDGVSASDTLRSLVATLDASDVIVYLHDGRCSRPAEACLMIVKTAGATRLVHINFRISGAGPGVFLAHQDRLIAQIGHELQHAVEIANHREVSDAATLSVLYERIGERRGSPDGIRYETEAAIHAGQQVSGEIHERRRPRLVASTR